MPLRFSATLMLLLAPVLAGAHHPLDALYDHGRKVTLTGTVTRYEWVNPHVVFMLEVPGAKGPTIWRMELDAPNFLQRRGWSKQSLAAGQQVVVTAYPLKSGEPAAVALTIKLADGTELTATTDGSWSWQQVGK